MDKQFFINIVGCIFCITGILDAWKYAIQGFKVRKLNSSKTISRQFLNFAILNDLVKLLYGILIWDFYVTGTSILALIAMLYMWWEVYLFYPYRNRGLYNFRRPNILIYIWNSILSNRIRKHL